jgi:hypothetical protein
MSQHAQITSGVQPNQSDWFLRRWLWLRLVQLVRPAALCVLSLGPAICMLCATVCFAATRLNAPAAGAPYSGDGLRITPMEHGAWVHCAFQRLDGEATREGLWLSSTVPDQLNDRFRVKAVAVSRNGRAGSPPPAEGVGGGPSRTGKERPTTLLATGDVSVEGQTVRFTRPGLTEEYTVSMDGVMQDFLVLEQPRETDAQLRVELAVTGALVEQTAYGAQLVLEQSGRKIAYSRLKATDAHGKELPARMEVANKSEIKNQKSEIGLAVVLDDSDAIYPVRIDPTFSDANWTGLGGLPGANGFVLASVVDGAGNLYIGGEFTEVGAVVATNIAKWNGSAWSALGSGVGSAIPGNRSEVYTLAVSGSNVYAGGFFTTAGGNLATNIAKWDGTTWSAMGAELGGFAFGPLPAGVYALAASGSDVYASGTFPDVGPATFFVTKWNGSNWSALGSGMDYLVEALAVSGRNVFAGGGFSMAGGVPVHGIAKWDGSAWSALGLGVISGGVAALAVSGSDLYVGGYFTNAGGITATNIAKWDGTNWSALGSGVNDFVRALTVSDTNLYVGATNYVLKWDGNTWNALGSVVAGGVGNPPPAVWGLAASGKDVFAVGTFSTAGNGAANYIAKWNGNAWSALGSGLGGAYASVWSLAVSGNDLYAGGSFAVPGGIAGSNVAKWNGSSWTELGSGLVSVSSLAVSGTELYVGGNFTNAGGVAANYIAKWDGSAWSALGSGVGEAATLASPVQSLALSGSNLYAAGYFTTAGGIAANHIAKWDGSVWSALGSGVYSPPDALTVSGSDVYAAGYFTNAGGVAAYKVAKWDGSAWNALGSGMDGQVNALAVSGGNVYAGGFFTTAGGSPATNIAKWNGSAWSALGSGMDSTVYALAMSGSDLYAGAISREQAALWPIQSPNGTATPGARWAQGWEAPSVIARLCPRSPCRAATCMRAARSQ